MMPNITIPLMSNGTTVTRNVVQAVIRDICKATGFHNDPTIIISEDISSVRKAKTGDDDKVNSHITTDYEYLVFAEITEEIVDTKVLAHAKRNYKYTALIEDPALGFRVGTSYLPTKMTLSLRFRAKSKVFMRTWARKLALREKSRALSYPLDALYNYSLPPELNRYIANIHSLTESNAPYGRSLDAYIDYISKVETIVRSNKTGTYALDVVSERQRGLEGYFDSELIYNDKESTDGIHELSANFVFEYEQVAALNVSFPIIVHQQPIDQQYIDLWCGYTAPDEPVEHAIVSRIIGENASSTQRDIHDDGIIRNIPFSTWKPPATYPYMDTVAVLNLIHDDSLTVANLTELIDLDCPSYIVDYILQYPTMLMSYRDTPYMLSLYSVAGDDVHTVPMTVSPTGDLTIVNPLNQRASHYIVITAINDMSKLHNPCIRKFLANKTYTAAAMAYIFPGVEFSNTPEVGKLHTPGGRDRVTEDSFNKLILLLRSTDKVLKQANAGRPVFIQQANLIARRNNVTK